MPKFHSLRTVYPPQINDEPGEPLPAYSTDVTEDPQDRLKQEIERTAIQTLSGRQHAQARSTNPLHSVQPTQSSAAKPAVKALSSQYTASHGNAAQALQPLPSTQSLPSYQPQSLLTALQATMEPKTNRLPVFIPAEMKKVKQRSATEVLSPATRKTISRFKLGIVLGAMTAFLFLTAFSFGPANQGKNAFPLLANLLQQWQEQGPNSVLSLKPAKTNVSAVVAPGLPNIPQSDLVTLARQDAIKYGISPDYFVRQIYAESGFNPNAYSPAGAIGIAQFIPSTAASLGVNPYDPVSSLDGAARHMASLSNQFGGDYAKALGAYNAGPGAVQNAVRNGGANWLSLMPLETQNYIVKIMG